MGPGRDASNILSVLFCVCVCAFCWERVSSVVRLRSALYFEEKVDGQ
jgi:hypothetical protein